MIRKKQIEVNNSDFKCVICKRKIGYDDEMCGKCNREMIKEMEEINKVHNI